MMWLQRLVHEEDGQGLVEYGLILALVAVVVVAILGALGGQLNTIFGEILDKLKIGGGTPVVAD